MQAKLIHEVVFMSCRAFAPLKHAPSRNNTEWEKIKNLFEDLGNYSKYKFDCLFSTHEKHFMGFLYSHRQIHQRNV